MPATKNTAVHPELPDLHGAEEDVVADLGDIVDRLQSTRIAPGHRYIVILRVSKTEGREKLAEGFIAEPEQLGKCEDYVKTHGGVIVDIRRERNVSGGSVDRDVLMGAVADVIAGKADGIIVARVNRYARTTAGLQMVRKLQAAGKTFVAVDEGIGPDMLQTSFGWFAFTIMLAVAELQLGMLTEGFVTARRIHIAAGIANQTPYGYRKREGGDVEAKDPRSRPRRLEPDPKTSKYVKYMFDRRAAGDSWITIAKALDKKGAPVPGGGKLWLYTRVRGIVQNRIYLGELSSGEFRNATAHFPLVTLKQWEDANELNQTPARNGKAAYPLTGIVRCATCGGRMIGFMQTVKAGRKRDGEPRKYQYYRCRRIYSWGRCPGPANASAHELEQIVVNEFFRRFVHDLDATRRADDRSTDLTAAQAAIDEALADYDRFTNSPSTRRTAEMRGDDWYEAEVDKRNDAISLAQRDWQEIRNEMSGMELPPGLETEWPGLSCDEQRAFLSDAFGVVAVRHSGGRRVAVAERVRIWARNEKGSPEAKLAARDANGRIIKVPIKF